MSNAPTVTPGEVIDALQVTGEVDTKPKVLLNTGRLKLLRLTLPAGKKVAEHKAPGEITVHCLKGHVAFTVAGDTVELLGGQLLYLLPDQLHSLEAIEDSIVLVTIRVP